MQPILVVSPTPQLAEACRHMLPEGLLQVFHEADWLQALALAAYRPLSAIVVDVRHDQADPFMIGRILMVRTRRPVLFVDGVADLRRLTEEAAIISGMLEMAAPHTDEEGWTPFASDDIAASKATATRTPVVADLVRKAVRRVG